MNAASLYFRYVRTSLRGQAQYPGTLLVTGVGQFLATGAAFVGLWARFDRFGSIQGFRISEAALFYGFAQTMFAVADASSRGFEVFGSEFLRKGDFDRILLRPRSTVLQIFGHEFRLTKFGRFSQGAIVFVTALALLPGGVSPGDAALLALAFTGGIALFCGLLIIQATICFWTTESVEAMNALTYGGVEAAQYPLSVYQAAVRRLLFYVVPLAAVTYHPLLIVLRHADPLGAPPWLGYVSPLFGFAFFGVAIFVWNLGVRRYTSTGS
jgi:ABC-2 type transport system permease protein